MSDRIYLDNAATSWPKPASVYEAMDRYSRENGAPLGRGTSRQAIEVSRTVQQCRLHVGKLIDCSESNRIVFTTSGTDSLNLALHGILKPGDHVITSQAEHNSVLRPLRAAEDIGVEVDRVQIDGRGFVSPDDVRKAIRPNTKMIAIIHASNVTGAIQPVEEIGRISRENDLIFLLDAAQTLGHLEVSIETINCDLLAAPGHKGLLGPTGTGILYVGPRAEAILSATRQGGTGTQSENDVQPDQLPEKLEAGNHNVPGIYGLLAGAIYVAEETPSRINQREMQLSEALFDRFNEMSHVKIFTPERNRVGVISIQIEGLEPQEAATILESTSGIQCRAGFHCTPRIHQAIGSSELGGTIRFSVGMFNTMEEIETLLNVVSDLA